MPQERLVSVSSLVLPISKNGRMTKVQRNPLVWALPLQALLLFSNLDLLDPWVTKAFPRLAFESL
jgi:hypothetical protein